MQDLPKSFLEPWLLLLLRTWSGHGYGLGEALNRMGFTGVDHTRIYRQLRELERRGLLFSSWDVASHGPAKRVYKLTQAGEEFLAASAQALDGYAKMVNAFTDLYAGAFKSLTGLQASNKTGKPEGRKGGRDAHQ